MATAQTVLTRMTRPASSDADSRASDAGGAALLRSRQWRLLCLCGLQRRVQNDRRAVIESGNAFWIVPIRS